MAEKTEPRYDITMPFEVVKIEDGERGVIARLTVEYFDLPYEGLVAVELKVLDFVRELGELGRAKVEAMGKGKKLAELEGR